MGISKYKSRYLKIDPKHPDAKAVCDYTHIVTNRSKLKKQMDYRGDPLVWTGFLVHEDYLDKPQQQFRPPPLKPDPVPVINPRIVPNPVDAPASLTAAQAIASANNVRWNI